MLPALASVHKLLVPSALNVETEMVISEIAGSDVSREKLRLGVEILVEGGKWRFVQRRLSILDEIYGVCFAPYDAQGKSARVIDLKRWVESSAFDVADILADVLVKQSVLPERGRATYGGIARPAEWLLVRRLAELQAEREVDVSMEDCEAALGLVRKVYPRGLVRIFPDTDRELGDLYVALEAGLTQAEYLQLRTLLRYKRGFFGGWK
jgi:hypothetical protein